MDIARSKRLLLQELVSLHEDIKDLTIRVKSEAGFTSSMSIPSIMDLRSYPQKRFVEKLANSFKIATNSRMLS
jgi:hypothetical protein